MKTARLILLLKWVFNSDSYERDPQMGHEKQPALIKLFIATEINKPSGATSGFSMVCFHDKVAYSKGNSLKVLGGRH